MLELIQAVQAALKASATLNYVKDNDIYITEDVGFVRAAGDYPAIGIKDNGTTPVYESSSQTAETMGLVVVPYVQLFDKEQAIIGGKAGQPGVLQMGKDILSVLVDNKLGDIVDLALPLRARPSILLPQKNRAIQGLPIDFQYQRWS